METKIVFFQNCKMKQVFVHLCFILSLVHCNYGFRDHTTFIRPLIRTGESLIIDKSFQSSKHFLHFKIYTELTKGGISYYDTNPSVSIQSNFSLSFQNCYTTDSRTKLVIYSYSQETFLSIIKTITNEATNLKRKYDFRYSFCEIFILNQTCDYSRDYGLEIKDLVSKHVHEALTNYSSSTGAGATGFPFNLVNDLYLIQYCHESKNDEAIFTFWEIYSVKATLFVNLIFKQNQILLNKIGQDTKFTATVVTLNLADFSTVNNMKLKRRQNMHGINITAAVFLIEEDENENIFEVEIGSDEMGNPKLLSGLSSNIYRDFQSVMNFTENILKIYFGLENYFVTSFLSDTYQFDINLVHSSVTKNRSEVAQPLHSTFFDGVHALFVQPFDQRVQNIYIKPFTSKTWTILACVWTCILLSCKFAIHLKEKVNREISDEKLNASSKDHENFPQTVADLKEKEVQKEEEKANNAKFEIGLWCVSVISQKGWSKIPDSFSIRVIVMTSLILSAVSYAAFTGKIVSELWHVPQPITSLQSLMSKTNKVYLINASDTSNDILEGLEKRSPDLLKKIRFRSIDKIYDKLVKYPGKACVITWPDRVISYVEQLFARNARESQSRADAYLCDTLSSFTYQSSSAMFVPKKSEFESLFNFRIIVGLERGFIRRYWNTYKVNSFLSCLERQRKVTTLDFAHVYFAFFILLFGMAISFSLMLLEATWNKIKWRIQFNLI